MVYLVCFISWVESSLGKTYNNLYHKFYWDDYEEKTTGNLTTRYWYVNGPGGLIGLYVEEQTPNGTVSKPMVAVTDHLGSIEGLFGNNNYSYYAAVYDEWGNRDVLLLYGLSHGFDRGYTGHEHIDGLGLINMNGRMYDPLLGRFLSPDPYVQAPTDPQNFNRYSYCLNNPLKYTDPSGEIVWAPIIIGAIIGTYSGGVLANDGNFDPTMWNWQSSKTWGYMAGGMLTGALSGAAGAAIASSGIPMANTLSIMGGSLTNSLGTFAYTGGQTDITMSFGFASYNFTQHSFGAIWDKKNTPLDYVGYSLGLLANISDLLAGLHPEDVTGRVENNPRPYETKDMIGHYQINKEEILIDWGPLEEKDKLLSLLDGTNNYEAGRLVENVNGSRILDPVTIKNVNVDRIRAFGQYINNHSRYNLLYNNCVNMASRALNMSGVFNIGIHPYLLQTEMFLRFAGVRPLLFSYYGINEYKKR